MKAGKWIACWLIIVIAAFSICIYWVVVIDPYFHYHKPDTSHYYYELGNQRSQNDGIVRHFDYDTLIIGSSMTENFRPSECDAIFGGHAIKVCFPGASFKEIDDCLESALKANDKLKRVIRCLDMNKLLDDSDSMRFDLGKYPFYLYDRNPFNDWDYLLYRGIVFGKVYKMIDIAGKNTTPPGIMSFDDYEVWQDEYSYGIDSLYPDGIQTSEHHDYSHLSDADKLMIKQNIEENVTDTADRYPDVEYLYYYSPYSAACWNDWNEDGSIYKYLEAEEYITELILEHKNIKLFSFNNRTDITTDLNNYRDSYHYAIWVNSLIFKWMNRGEGLLTAENYKSRLDEERDFYTNYDYASLNDQEDYEADYYAGALLNRELTGAAPVAYISNNPESEKSGSGISIDVDTGAGYNYLSFYAQKSDDCADLSAYIYDDNGQLLATSDLLTSDSDQAKHQFALDLSRYKGTVKVELSVCLVESEREGDIEIEDLTLY